MQSLFSNWYSGWILVQKSGLGLGVDFSLEVWFCCQGQVWSQISYGVWVLMLGLESVLVLMPSWELGLRFWIECWCWILDWSCPIWDVRFETGLNSNVES